MFINGHIFTYFRNGQAPPSAMMCLIRNIVSSAYLRPEVFKGVDLLLPAALEGPCTDEQAFQ